MSWVIWGGALNALTNVLIRERQVDNTEEAEVLCPGGRDWSEAVRSEGMPTTTQKLEEARNGLSLRACGWSAGWPCRHFDFSLMKWISNFWCLEQRDNKFLLF